jgi:hypothetical protein
VQLKVKYKIVWQYRLCPDKSLPKYRKLKRVEMNRLALAVKLASEDALTQVSLESLASDVHAECLGFESDLTYVNDMVTLAGGLEATVVSVESIEQPTMSQYRLAREQAFSFLKMSGLSDCEVAEIVPSLEADDPKTAWQKFKDFLVRLWNFIVNAAKKLYQFVDTILKKSSLAEKAAMMQIRTLRTELSQKRDGLTIASTIKLRPAHRYLTACQLHSTSIDVKLDLPSITRNVDAFRKTRDAFQNKMPEVVGKVIEDLITVINDLALGGTDEQIAASVEAHTEAMKNAVLPMFPSGLKSALGFTENPVPLIYDRVLTIHDPAPGQDISTYSSNDVKDLIGQLGLSVDQVEHPLDPASAGTFPALRISEIEQILKLAAVLIDEGHSADQQRKWKRLRSLSMSLGMDVESTIKVVLKREGLSSDARSALTLALNTRQAMNRWISAPFLQINTVNIRVVEALLALASDQLKNYELKDSAQERDEKKKSDKSKPEVKKESKRWDPDGDHEYRN